MTDTTAASRLPGELRVLAVRLEALGMNARPLWDAAKLAAAHAKKKTCQGKPEPAYSGTTREDMRRDTLTPSAKPDAGLSAEREAEIRELERWCVAGQPIRTAPRWLGKWPSGMLTGRLLTDLLAALDAERERRKVMERRGDNLKVEAGTWRDFAHFHKERADRAEQQAETLAEALQQIGDSYGWESYRDNEVVPAVPWDDERKIPPPTNRRIVREALIGYRAGRDEAKP